MDETDCIAGVCNTTCILSTQAVKTAGMVGMTAAVKMVKVEAAKGA